MPTGRSGPCAGVAVVAGGWRRAEGAGVVFDRGSGAMMMGRRARAAGARENLPGLSGFLGMVLPRGGEGDVEGGRGRNWVMSKNRAGCRA